MQTNNFPLNILQKKHWRFILMAITRRTHTSYCNYAIIIIFLQPTMFCDQRKKCAIRIASERKKVGPKFLYKKCWTTQLWELLVRISKFLSKSRIVAIKMSLSLISKWGYDGSSGYAIYRQSFSNLELKMCRWTHIFHMHSTATITIGKQSTLKKSSPGIDSVL